MDITVFIRELLYGYDCVIVPGFGGFIGNHVPARIDENSWTFFPPFKKISFNRNLDYNDGLLIGRISLTLKVSYGDAKIIIDNFVIDVRSRMSHGEKVLFDHIGSLSYNHESNVQFEPDMNTNYDLDSYGLESFQRNPREGYDVRRRIFRRFNKDPEKRTSLKKILWRAAIIVPILAILVVVPLKTDLFKSKMESSTMNPLAKAELDDNKSIVEKGLAGETVYGEEVTASEESLQANESSAPDSKPVIMPAQAGSGNLFIVTGSFRSRENAASQVNELKTEGFIAEIIEAQNGFFRVSAQRCPDMESATAIKERLSVKYPGTWISRK